MILLIYNIDKVIISYLVYKDYIFLNYLTLLF